MRIGNFIEEARMGGPQIRNLKVASALKKKIEIVLIFPKENSKDYKKNCKLLKIQHLSLPLTTIKRGFINIISYVFFFFFEVVMLARTFKKYNFDLIHVSGGCWQSKGIFAAKLAGIRVIWELNDTNTHGIFKKLFFFINNLADGFIFASEKTKIYYKELISSKKKSYVIQSPVDLDFFNPNLTYLNDKFFKRKNKKKVIIGTIANVNPVKNLELFLEVAKKLSRYSKEVIFIVVGSIYSSQKKYYNFLNYKKKKLNLKNFFFLNSRKDIRPLLKIIDIYVCASKNESSPLSVWEAMSMEKAIVSTDVGDVKKFVIDGKNGFIVNVNDAHNLAYCVKKFIENPGLRKNFGKKSRMIANNKLNINICSKLHFLAYKSIAKLNL